MPPTPPGLAPTIKVQSLINFWSGEPTAECIQALVHAPQVLLLQVDRFELHAGMIRKRMDLVEANRRVVMPVFSEASLNVTVVWYELMAVISHHGPHPQVGTSETPSFP